MSVDAYMKAKLIEHHAVSGTAGIAIMRKPRGKGVMVGERCPYEYAFMINRWLNDGGLDALQAIFAESDVGETAGQADKDFTAEQLKALRQMADDHVSVDLPIASWAEVAAEKSERALVSRSDALIWIADLVDKTANREEVFSTWSEDIHDALFELACHHIAAGATKATVRAEIEQPESKETPFYRYKRLCVKLKNGHQVVLSEELADSISSNGQTLCERLTSYCINNDLDPANVIRSNYPSEPIAEPAPEEPEPLFKVWPHASVFRVVGTLNPSAWVYEGDNLDDAKRYCDRFNAATRPPIGVKPS